MSPSDVMQAPGDMTSSTYRNRANAPTLVDFDTSAGKSQVTWDFPKIKKSFPNATTPTLARFEIKKGHENGKSQVTWDFQIKIKKLFQNE